MIMFEYFNQKCLSCKNCKIVPNKILMECHGEFIKAYNFMTKKTENCEAYKENED